MTVQAPTRTVNEDRMAGVKGIDFSAASIAGTLALISLCLILIAIVGQIARWNYGSISGLISVFDLDAEKNVPALFSGFIMMLSSAIVWIIQRIEPDTTLRTKWRVLAAGLMLMCLDEVFRLHERPMEPLREMLGGGDLGVFTFAWVIPALILLPFVGLYFARFLMALPAKTSRGFVLSGLLFLGGAVGLEMVGGRYFGQFGSDFAQSMIAIAEESCEFFGICFFIYVALSYLAANRGVTPLRFHP